MPIFAEKFLNPDFGPKRGILGPKIPFFDMLSKYRHVTPRLKSFGLRIKKKTILGHFDLIGPKMGPKGSEKP